MLYQNGTKRIEVIVRKEGSGLAGARQVDTDEVSGGSSLKAKLLGSDKVSRQKRVLKTNLTHTLAVAKQVLDLGIEHAIGGLGYKHGDQALQDRISRSVEQVKDVTNVASSIGMGALYGSWGGPLGAALGAVFGAVSTGTSLAVKYGGRKRDYDYKVFKENNAIEYNRARAGINLTSGRLR